MNSLKNNFKHAEIFIKDIQKKIGEYNINFGKLDGYLGKKTFDALKKLNAHKNKEFKNNLPKAKNSSNSKYQCELDKIVHDVGFEYNSKEDIYCSMLNPWQRNIGYCYFYDEISIYSNMVINCEPICFQYQGENWMIELWKGQYGISTGCEIGVYKEEFDIHKHFKFYSCVDDNNLLNMSYTLKNKDKEVFKREGKHWWLTGFKPGIYSIPEELEMSINIQLKDQDMQNSFYNELKKMGYDNVNLNNDLSVNFVYKIPHSKQPTSYTKDHIEKTLELNRDLCKEYNEIKSNLNLTNNSPCLSINKIFEESPKLKDSFLILGKNKILKEFSNISNYIKI